MNATRPDDLSSPAWIDLHRELNDLESSFVELTRCMQRERECLTLFDVDGLRNVVARKEQLTRVLVEGNDRRVEVFEAVWAETGQRDALPDDVALALAHLAEQPSSKRYQKWLLDTASALNALQDVVIELQQLNRTMMGRAMSWMTAYISELHGGSSTYDARGRVVSQARASLARTI